MTEDNEKELDGEMCDCEHVHNDVVEYVENVLPDEDVLYEIAELFKVFGDSTRTRIISALFEKELCVCDIADLLHMTKSAVSHQLRTLRQTKIVKSRRSGKEIFYSLDDEHIKKIYQMALEHLKED